MTPLELLRTTRTVRRRLDLNRSVPLDVVRRCVDVARQAPSASNGQGAHFVVVTDAGRKEELAALYRRSYADYRSSDLYPTRIPRPQGDAETQARVAGSADHLAENLHRVPVLVVPCMVGRPAPVTVSQASLYGSALPAVWNFMLAARLEGLGTALTTLHLRFEEEAAELLGIPYPEVTQVGLVPVAYTVGDTFRPAPRGPVDEIMHVDGWS